jgi:hypothetical protein
VKTAKRKKLEKSQFGLPGERKYPMPDKEHAANAKARAKQQRKRGKLSRAAYDKVVAKANRVLGKSKKSSKRKASGS